MSFHRKVLLYLFILSILFIIPNSVASNFGCCINTVSGCQTLFDSEQISLCVNSGFDFIGSKVCYPLPHRPDLEVVDDQRCRPEGCCCIGDGFQVLTNDECSQIGGNFKEGQNCNEVCGISTPVEDLTCHRAGGFWCLENEKNPNSKDITNILDNINSGRPSDEYFCYDLPCELSKECPIEHEDFKGNEIFCTDGKDNSGNCLVDSADPDCRYTVKGKIVDNNGFPRSNVLVKFTNLDHKEHFSNIHVDSFKTYSVGASGEFFFLGLSQGKYKAEIIDDFYKSDIYLEFEVGPNRPQPNLNFIVTPRNVFSIKGRVIANWDQGVSGALVYIQDSNYFARTDSKGEYSIDLIVVRPGNYNIIAHKEGYHVARKTISNPLVGEQKTIDFNLAPNDCETSPSVPNLENLTLKKGTPNINLFFNSGACFAEEIHIYRCEGLDECNDLEEGAWEKIKTVSGYITEYFDDDSKLSFNKHYSYYLRSTYGSYETNFSNILTIHTGDERCSGMIDSRKFCIFEFSGMSQFRTLSSSRGVYCDDENIVRTSVVCSDNTKCFETNSGTPHSSTTCREIDVCTPNENNFFGLFFSKNSCQGVNNNRFCVYDYSPTNTNYCYSCKSYSGCLDYNSESSCLQNICGVGSCNWSVTNEVLGTGICYDQSSSDCSKCASPFNRFFGVCDSQTCSLLGNCAFSNSQNECISCNGFSCFDYSDRQSCTGGVDNLILDRYTNIMSKGSKDSCGIGSCVWQDNACFKDSNVDRLNDCQYFQNNRLVISSQYGSAYTMKTCLEDSIPPTTSVSFSRRYFNPLSPVNGKIELNFNAFDKTSDGLFDVKEVYYCIAPSGRQSSLCSDISKFDTVRINSEGERVLILSDADNSLGIKPTGNKIFQLSPGKNMIRFFSVDHANNLEVVKEEEFYLDHVQPKLNVDIIRMPNFANRNTDLSIIVNSDEPVFCHINVLDCLEMGNCDANFFNKENVTENFIKQIMSKFTVVFSREFKSLIDGNHIFNIVCTDLSGNIAEIQKNVLLDADPRVTNPKPTDPTDRRQTMISVNTISAVNCRYTQNLNLRFDQIPSSNSMSSIRKGSIYEHTAVVSLVESKPYEFYVKCDYLPVAVEKISFTYDVIPPQVTATLGGRLPLKGVGWLSDAKINLECLDEPKGGFGCNETKYCLRQVPSLSDPNLMAKCVPNLIIENEINITSPSTLCYNSQEKVINGMGGLSSETECINVFVDNQDPQILLDYLPTSTNINALKISGRVYDDFNTHKIKLEENKDYETLFGSAKYYSSFTDEFISANKFDYLIEVNFGDMVSQNKEQSSGKIKLVFSHESHRKYGALVFDLSEKTVSFGSRQNLLGFRNVEIKNIPDSYLTGRKHIKITKDESGISASISDPTFTQDSFIIKTSSSTLMNLNQGFFGVIVEDSTKSGIFRQKFNDASFGELSVLHPGSAPFADTDKKVYLKINNQARSSITTKNYFNIETKLTEGIPRHGSVYQINIYATDISGRESKSIIHNIVYDLSGPNTESVSFIPTIEQEKQDYIEFDSNSEVLVKVSDDYSGVSKVVVRVRNQEILLNKISDLEWKATFPSANLPIGKHDVFVESYDGLGNKNIDVFEEKLLIEDRIDPKIILNLDNSYFNTATPVINFTTQEAATCSAFYKNNLGEDVQTTISTVPTLKHTLKITSPLVSENGREIKNEILLVCSDRNENKADVLIGIFIDFRIPLYTIIPHQSSDLYVSNMDRHKVEFTSIISGPRTFNVYSDEPVKCKYDFSDSGFPQGDYKAMSNLFLSSHSYRLNDVTSLVPLQREKTQKINFQCEDRSGNLGHVKTIEITVNPNTVPLILNYENKISINNDSKTQEFRFSTVRRSVDCSYKLSGKQERINPSSVGSVLNEYVIDISELAEGHHLLELSCNHDGRNTKKLVDIYKYLSTPTIIFNKNITLSESNQKEIITLDSSSFNFDLSSSRKVLLKIYNSNTLVDIIDVRNNLNHDIPLKYGINDLKFVIVDDAKNYLEYGLVVENKKEIPAFSFSNFLGGSIRREFSGEISSSSDLSNAYLKITGNKITETIPISSSRFRLNEELLRKVSGISLSSSPTHIEPIKIEVLKEDLVLYRESFWFNPYTETFSMINPNSEVITNLNLRNHQHIGFFGEIIQENYAYNYKINYAEEVSDLKVNLSLFKEEKTGIPGLNIFNLEGINDLGAPFRISSSIDLKTDGPNPHISLYPSGQVSFTSSPSFIVSVQTPSKIIDAWITDLENNYSVGNFNPSSFIFSKILQTTKPLSNEGQYYLNVIAESNLGIRDQYQFSFEYSKRDFSIILKDPTNGYSASENFTAIFESDRIASCRYSSHATSFENMDVISSMSFEHKINLNILNGETQKIFLACSDFEGTESRVFEFSFFVDSSPPTIKSLEIINSMIISQTNYIVEYPLLASLNVVIDKDSSCRYELIKRGESFNKNYSDMIPAGCGIGQVCYAKNHSWNVGNLEDKAAYDIAVICKSKSGIFSDRKIVYFQVDVSQGDRIRIISPEKYSSSTSISIEVKTNSPTKNCSYSFGNDTVSNRFTTQEEMDTLHKASARLSEGMHRLNVLCNFDGDEHRLSRNFIIDSSKPIRGTVIVDPITASNTRLNAVAVNFSDPESGIKVYEYAIGTSPFGQTGWNSVLNWTQTQREVFSESGLNLTYGVTYYWSVRAFNNVNLDSEVVSSTGTTITTSNQTQEDYDRCNSEGLCGPECEIPCDVGDICIFDEDCYNPDLICESNRCVRKESVVDIRPPGVDYDEHDFDQVATKLVQKDIQTSVIKTSHAWIYWLLALGLLAMISGGGYYAYVSYFKEEEKKGSIKNESSKLNSGTKLNSNSNNAASNFNKGSSLNDGGSNFESQQKVIDEQKLARKEELKKALKRKLVEDQKQKETKSRSEIFDKFDVGKK